MLLLIIAVAAFLCTALGGLLALRLRDKLHLILGFRLEHVFADFALMIRVVTHAAPKKLKSWPAI